MAFGPRNLIEAIANGKQAALSIDNCLRDVKGRPEIRFSIRKISTRDYRMPEDYEQHARQAPPTTPIDRRTGFSEVEMGYSEPEARLQAERCLSCHIQTIYNADTCVSCATAVWTFARSTASSSCRSINWILERSGKPHWRTTEQTEKSAELFQR